MGLSQGLPVNALIVFDDGTGPALNAASGFSVARWTGTAWAFLGSWMNSVVLTLAVFDECFGLCPAL